MQSDLFCTVSFYESSRYLSILGTVEKTQQSSSKLETLKLLDPPPRAPGRLGCPVCLSSLWSTAPRSLSVGLSLSLLFLFSLCSPSPLPRKKSQLPVWPQLLTSWTLLSPVAWLVRAPTSENCEDNVLFKDNWDYIFGSLSVFPFNISRSPVYFYTFCGWGWE